MEDYDERTYLESDIKQRRTKKNERYLLHIGLFIITFITTTIAGAEWIRGTFGRTYEFSYLIKGLP